ncbi:hypothetical protein PIB30_069371 [Stylosanthes scabra]|uniref:Uncharacterized protein n=1 Tax=Stylosanthes scabra TaxID=79078 RepID=A0ABU6TMV3_9FABA|nr:hypothetical protein [Stylosanthes scabra]
MLATSQSYTHENKLVFPPPRKLEVSAPPLLKLAPKIFAQHIGAVPLSTCSFSKFGEIGCGGMEHVVCRALGSIQWLLFQLMCGGGGRVSLLAIFFLVHVVLPSFLSVNGFCAHHGDNKRQ